MRRIVSLVAALGTLILAPLASPATPLSLDRLYRLPWLIGTSPMAPAWSNDSRHLAFLWNDDGGNFRDVWVVDIPTGSPRRWTTMPRRAPSTAPDPTTRRAEEARAETDPGVTALAWTGGDTWLVFLFHGQAYRIREGSPAEPLTDLTGITSVTTNPRNSVVALTANGALWTVDAGVQSRTANRLYDANSSEVEIESVHFTPDGNRIAFLETDARAIRTRGLPDYLGEETRLVPIRRAFPGEPAEQHRVGFVRIADGAVAWADLGGDREDLVFSIAWSPDGRTLLVDKSDLYIKDRRLFLIDQATGASRTLVRETDAGNVTAEWWADWAPNGKGVYFTSDRDNDYHLYYTPIAGGAPHAVTAGPWAVFSAVISPRDGALLVVGNPTRPEDRSMLRVPLSGGTYRVLGPSHGHHEPTVSPDGRWIADLYSNDVTPPDLYLEATDPRHASRRPLTHSPFPEFNDYRWVAARYVEFKNVNDGTPLHARLTLPPDFDPSRKYPAILGSVYSNTVHNRWGGRVYHPTWALDQYLASRGYVVMNVDISGSSGHGKEFRQRIREDYGGVDVEDLYSGVRYLIDEGYIDPKRVGLWGSSYGGLLTTMSLFKKPGVYRAGVAGAPATSLFHAETGEMRTMMAPQDHPAQYAAASPFLHSDGLRDPLLIIHGMRDDTVLFQDTMTLTERLILGGHDVDVAVLPDAPHGWDTQGLAQTRFAFHKLVEFFKRHLGEGPSP